MEEYLASRYAPEIGNRMVEVDAELIREKKAAVLLDVGKNENIWVPRSCCRYKDVGTWMIVEWFALKKGII